MRIGLVLPGFNASEGDRCIPALAKLVRELARRDEIHVFALRYPHRRAVYSVYGATVHAFGGAGARDLARLPFLGRALWSILTEHRRRPFDVIHGLWADEPGFIAVGAARVLGIPSVVSLLGGELVGFADIGYGSQISGVNRQMVRIALQGAHAVTAGSKYLNRLAAPYVSPERLHAIPIGVDTDLFHLKQGASLRLAGEFKLLHVASLVPVKDQRILLEVLSAIQRVVPGVHLHLVGSGPLREKLEGWSRSLGVASHLTFYGAVPHDALPDYYGAADLCVLASRHEGQEWVTQEAAFCGRATVGTEVGVVPDLAPSTLAVPVGDPAALGHAVARIALNPKEATHRGLAAHEQVVGNYSLSLTVRNLHALYTELAVRTRSVSGAFETPATS